MSSKTYTALGNWINIAASPATNLGYDQGDRMSFLDLVNHRIRPNTETDCSALVLGLYALAGYPIDMTPPIFTGTVEEKLGAIGSRIIPIRGWTVQQIQARATMMGAVVLNRTHHVIIQTGKIGSWLSANIDERGLASGGRAGDQTGNEVSVRPLWLYHAGWDVLILPPDYTQASSASVTPTQAAQTLPQQTITLKPDATKRLQHVLKVAEDGVIGPQTIGAWQARMGTTADRVVNIPSELVRTVQVYLNHIRDGIILSRKTVQPAWTTLTTDGVWGPMTQAATEEYLLHWNGGFTR